MSALAGESSATRSAWTADRLLTILVGVEVAFAVSSLALGPVRDARHGGSVIFWLAVSLALIWVVRRGSRAAWAVLLVLIVLPLGLLLSSLSGLTLYILGLLTFAAVELGILVSAPVRQHIRGGTTGQAVESGGDRRPAST